MQSLWQDCSIHSKIAQHKCQAKTLQAATVSNHAKQAQLASPGWDGKVQGDAQQLGGRQGSSLGRCGSSGELHNALQGVYCPGQALLGLRALPCLGTGLGYADERACQLLCRRQVLNCCWFRRTHS